MPTPLTRALSSISGRVMARTISALSGDERLINYTVFRLIGMKALINEALPPEESQPYVLNPICGYSALLLMLAAEMPHLHAIEIDLPQVIDDKIQRLRRAHDYTIPTNIEWFGRHLDDSPLGDILAGRLMDAIVALPAYIKGQEFVDVLKYLRQHLKPGGVIVASFPWRPGYSQLK